MTADRVGLEHEINLRRLLLFRVVTATALLIPALYSQFLAGTQRSLVPVHASIALVYGVCLLYVVAQRVGMTAGRLLSLQLTIDVALVTLLVHVFGGARSPLVFLYLVLAIGAGVMTGRQTALAIACLTAVSYGLLIHLRAAGWLPIRELGLGQPGPPVTPPEMYLRILMLLFAACMIVALASSYTERLRGARGSATQGALGARSAATVEPPAARRNEQRPDCRRPGRPGDRLQSRCRARYRAARAGAARPACKRGPESRRRCHE